MYECLFFYHKSHMDWPEIEREASEWEAVDQPPEP